MDATQLQEQANNIALWGNVINGVLAVGGLAIAYFTFQISKQQTKIFDTQNKILKDQTASSEFEFKYEVYAALLQFINIVQRDKYKVEEPAFMVMWSARAKATFLYPEEIREYLMTVFVAALEIEASISSKEETQDTRTKKKWFSDQYIGSIALFEPYLAIHRTLPKSS